MKNKTNQTLLRVQIIKALLKHSRNAHPQEETPHCLTPCLRAVLSALCVIVTKVLNPKYKNVVCIVTWYNLYWVVTLHWGIMGDLGPLRRAETFQILVSSHWCPSESWLKAPVQIQYTGVFKMHFVKDGRVFFHLSESETNYCSYLNARRMCSSDRPRKKEKNKRES